MPKSKRLLPIQKTASESYATGCSEKCSTPNLFLGFTVQCFRLFKPDSSDTSLFLANSEAIETDEH